MNTPLKVGGYTLLLLTVGMWTVFCAVVAFKVVEYTLR